MAEATYEDDMNADSESEGSAIDTHVHFWKYDKKRNTWITNDMKILQKNYLPENLALSFKRNGVEGCVAVQADPSELETLFLVELAKTHKMILGVVGWVDLQAANVEERLAYFSQFHIIKGFRHVVQSEPADFLTRPNFLRGVRALKPFGYTYDILIYHYQLEATTEFVEQFPGQKMIIDHCAKPDIRKKDIKNWRTYMMRIANNPYVYCKLSGLLTEASWQNWSAADFYPYLDTVFEAFGTDRLVFGSDWPVILLSGIYVQWKSLLEKYMEGYKPEERDKVFRLNAIKFYNL
jgi:L-fucono-1,5-lactonase